MKRKLLVVLLALAMLVTLTPMAAFAGEETAEGSFVIEQTAIEATGVYNRSGYGVVSFPGPYSEGGTDNSWSWYGLVDKDGNYVIPAKPNEEYVKHDTFGNTFFISDGMICDYKKGYYNLDGTKAFELMDLYDTTLGENAYISDIYAMPFHDGKAIAKLEYEEEWSSDGAGGFNYDASPYMVIDKDGNVLNEIDEYPGRYYGGEGFTQSTNFTDQAVFYDYDGNTVIDLKDRGYNGFAGTFFGGYAWVKKADTGLLGYIDETGAEVIPCEYDSASGAGFGLFPVKKDGLWGLVDADNAIVIPFEYESAFPFGDGLAAVMKDGKYGVIDTEQNIVIPLEYDDISDFSEGTGYAIKDGVLYIISRSEGGQSQEDVITAAYERTTPFEVVMERDFKDYGGGLQYVGEMFDYPDAEDKVTFTFPDGTVKVYEYQKSGSSSGKFVNTADSTDVITNSDIFINILDQAYDWEPGGDKNYYEVSFLNYPEDGSSVTCQVPVEVSSTPVASIDYQPKPRFKYCADGSVCSWIEGDTVIVKYKDGSEKTFVFRERFEDNKYYYEFVADDGETVLTYGDLDSYYYMSSSFDAETQSYSMSYLGVSDTAPGSVYIAQSMDFIQAEPLALYKGKDSTDAEDESGETYQSYSLPKELFKEGDKIVVNYENTLGDELSVEFPYSDNGGFTIDPQYKTGNAADDNISTNYLYFNSSQFESDQADKHLEPGDTYDFDFYWYCNWGGGYDYPEIWTEGKPYSVRIKEAGPEDVTSVRFANSNVERIKKDETLQLSVTWEPSYAVVPKDAITWTSSDPAVATIDGNGLVSAVSEGSVLITAEINGNKAYKNVEVYEEKILSNETVSLSQTVFPYTGSNVYINNYVLYNGKSVPGSYLSTQYSQRPLNIGDYTATITGVYGGYSGTATENFTIKGDLNSSATNVKVTLDADEYVYEGTFVQPEVTVTAVGKGGETATLTEGTDYTVAYMKNNAPGTGNVIISAAEESYYMGELFVPFTIVEEVKTGWVQDEDGDWYYYEDGTAATGWKKVSKKWYYMDEEGVMQTGWQKISSKWYYFNSSGAMQTGWVKISNKWYYFNSSGVMQTGWQKISGKQYFFKSSGAMAANEWVKGYYWVNKDGTWTYKYKASWKKSGSKWWFTDTSGWYAKNTTITIDGKKYTFDKSGWMV